jgi:hypothetical protein
MSERNAYTLFRKHFIQPLDRIDRIENLIGEGTPDLNMCLNGIELWIEFKQPVEPKRSDTPLFGSNHRLTQGQKNWIKRQVNAKGRVYLLIATNKRWLLIHGRYADMINDASIFTLISFAEWHTATPIHKVEWSRLRERLLQ